MGRKLEVAIGRFRPIAATEYYAEIAAGFIDIFGLNLSLKVLGTSQRRLSAVVQLGDIEQFVETLPVLANATLQRRDDATWLVPR